MLNQETSKFLSDTLGIDIEQLKTALTSDDEVEIKYNSGELLNEKQLADLKKTVKQTGYEEGKVVGRERIIKSIKQDYGAEIDSLDLSKVMGVLKTNTISDAKLPTDKKVGELTQSLETLQSKYTTDLELKDKEILSRDATIKGFETNSEISKHLPSGLKGITQSQFMTLAKSEFGFGFEESNFVVKQNGSIMKDSLEKPISPKEVLAGFAAKNGWTDKQGRGGSDEGGSGKEFKTEADVFKYLEDNNISFESDEGQKLIDSFNK